ncbi:hypothetical protein K2173_017120 [Erythroxylum novogranatense]|uniref:CASP-like protein n=1 Tax=Erythroxylum novogranatense TaxID=1862640 RepID=A0AAV8U9A8_9ROSI|nr:hypothetical protein K2173_017120 [Erythroxylum novogranatense]
MKAEPVEASMDATPRKRTSREISVVDLFLRILGVIGTLGSAMAMGTTSQTLSFFPQATQIRATYDDLPTFMFFVIANSVACGYLFLSLPLSIVSIVRSSAKIARVFLVVLDTVMMSLLTAGASASAAVVFLAHEGNNKANWSPICQQFDSFCERLSGCLIGSFVTVIMFIPLVIISAVVLSRS